MKFKKLVSVLVAGIFLGGVLAGCGGGQKQAAKGSGGSGDG